MKKNIAIVYAVLAAALYAANAPFSKLLLTYVQPTMMASFLYLGAGVGLMIYALFEKIMGKKVHRETLTQKELPYTIGMIVLDIVAPILLMLGIKLSSAANASLLNNFEIVATSVIALIIFKELISQRLWFAIFLVTIASVILSFEGAETFQFNYGSLFVLGACVCWGFENNCTKMISNKNLVEIVIIKGLFSGMGSLLVALTVDESLPEINWILWTLLLGFVAYGLSIYFYIMAQKELGAAKTSAYYSIAPFLGVIFGMLILGEKPDVRFWVALMIMIAGTYFMVKDTVSVHNKA